MTHPAELASLPPAVIVHVVAAVSALLVGPLALWAPKTSRWHRGAGHAWVTLMAVTVISSLFIFNFSGLNLAGFTPIHLLVPVTVGGIVLAFRALAMGRIAAHRQAMRSVYLGACVVAGLFTLMPGRYLGDRLWHHGLGWW
jgi:uncharacterized membrane protein